MFSSLLTPENLKKEFKRSFEYATGLLKNVEYAGLTIDTKRKRTLPQNALYWKWLTYLSLLTDIEKNKLHYLFRAKFLQKDLTDLQKVIDRNVLKRLIWNIENFNYCKEIGLLIDLIAKSTTELKTNEFNEYLERIRIFVLEIMDSQVNLPYPEQDNFKHFENELEKLKNQTI